MKYLSILLLASATATGQNITVSTATTYQKVTAFLETPAFPDLMQSNLYYTAVKGVVAPAIHNGLFRLNGIQIPVYPGDMYQDQDYFARFRAGSLTPANNYPLNYASCPVQGGDTRDSHSTFWWDNFAVPALSAISDAGNHPVVELRFTWDTESGTGPNCTRLGSVPAWWTNTVNATGWVNYLRLLIGTGRTTISEVNSGRWYISLINEPDLGTFKSSYWTTARMGESAAALRSALNTVGYGGVKIICCEWESLDNTVAQIGSVRTAAGAGVIDVWGSHLYHGNTTSNYAAAYTAATAAGGPIWQLEWFNGGITSLHNTLKYHWGGYQKFADGQEALGMCGIADDYSMVAITSTSCGAPFSNPQYRARGGSESASGLMAPYINTIHSGATAVDATTDNSDYDPVAFHNPDGSYATHIWVKATGTTPTVNVSGLPAGSYTWNYTKDNSNVLVTGGTLSCGGGTACSAAVPGNVAAPGAVLSFIGAAPPVAGRSPTRASPDNVRPLRPCEQARPCRVP
jgi:hypothetical protein